MTKANVESYYNQNTVTNAVGSVLNHDRYQRGATMVDDPVEAMYEGHLELAMYEALAFMYVNDYDRWGSTAQIIMNGYRQLKYNGFIIEK